MKNKINNKLEKSNYKFYRGMLSEVNDEGLTNDLIYNIYLAQRDLNSIYRRLMINNWWLTHHKKLFELETQSNVICKNEIEIISSDIYDKLNVISRFGNGKQGYSKIKRRR